MNFIKFSVDTTNIFPMANTTKGGQLVTEFNLTSRESVSSEESIKYKFGPSYVHAEEDFKVTALTPVDPFFPDSASIATSILQIAPGRGVIDGRFVENLVPMAVDLVAINAQLEDESSEPDTDESKGTEEPLSGNLAVGLRIMYSSEQTMAGSVNANTVSELDSGEYFEGIQVVILPKDAVRLPTTKFINEDGREVDCGALENEGKVNMHLLLATFTYFNGAIGDIVNNYPAKCQMLPAVRIGAIDNVISEDFLKKSGLNEKKIYALAGKGNTGGKEGYDTWCDVTDSMIIWDANPEIVSDADTVAEIDNIEEADFSVIGNTINLVLPHKQIDGETAGYDIKNANGDRVVYVPRVLQLPVADFGAGTPGTVDRNYTNHVKEVVNKINNFYQLTNGRQVYYIDTLNSRDELPPINEKWNPGDYILVRQDTTITSEYNDTFGITPPASLYVVLPPIVRKVRYSPEKPSGIELGRISGNSSENGTPRTSDDDYSIYNRYFGFLKDSTNPDNGVIEDISENEYRGVDGKDYFTYVFTEITTNADGAATESIQEYYYVADNVRTAVFPIDVVEIRHYTETSSGAENNHPDGNELASIREKRDIHIKYDDEQGEIYETADGTKCDHILPFNPNNHTEYMKYFSSILYSASNENTPMYRGVVGHDYFTYVCEVTTHRIVKVPKDSSADNDETEAGYDEVDIESHMTVTHYFVVDKNSKTDDMNNTVNVVYPYDASYVYSEPIQITAQIPFASEESVGGFLNVPESYIDAGYIILDGDGHLRLVDYALLRSGTLAYQLGEDFTVPTGQSIDEVQAYLDEYVNQRIAFPNIKHTQTAENPNIIDIYINLSESEEEKTLDIYDIDSRFQTAVRINILGTANDKITINVSDCARVIINSAIGGTPKINLYRSCLYYDHEVLEYLSKITDMTLWYNKFKDSDPSLLVDGMTVMFSNDRGLVSPDFNISSMEFWSPENVNDFHFKVALQSITFSSSGYIIGCGIFVGNDSTVNIRTGKFVCHNNNLDIPQGPNSLRFPRNRLVKSIYVTGQFVACYRDSNKNLYNIQNTSFSLKTPYYECDSSGNLKSGIPVNGEVAFYVDSALIESANPENIDVWEAGQFHLFNGSAIY